MKNLVPFLIVISFLHGCSYKQHTADGLGTCIVVNIPNADSIETKVTSFKIINESSFTKVPTFKGGTDSLEQKLKHPELARKMGVFGELVLILRIGGNGFVEKIEPVYNIPIILDELRRDLLELKFTPAEKNAIPVKSKIKLSILYRHKNEESFYNQ